MPQLKLKCLNSQKSDITTSSPCCSVLLWTGFCFLQVNQRKHVGMVSTNNKHTLNRSTNLFSKNHPTLYFWLNERFSIKMLFLKILQYSWGNTCVKFLRTPILKNICVWRLLNWPYEVIVWNFISGLHLKPSWLSNITKIPVAFNSKL